MLRNVIKVAGILSFLLLLSVPLAFYKYGSWGGLKQIATVAVIFAVTARWGHRWLRTFVPFDPPTHFVDSRLLVGFALTAIFVFFTQVPFFLGRVPGVLLSGFQSSIALGLLSSGLRRSGSGTWKRGFWKRREYMPAMLIIAFIGLATLAAFWSSLRWWSLLVLPVMFLGSEVAELIGRSIRAWLIALHQVWDVAQRMGPPIGAFAFGYVVIAFIFAGLFASVWRADPNAFKGISEHPALVDFGYYSVMTISTTGYGDITPQSGLTKILASAEALIGLAWTIVVFAAVLVVVQRHFQSSDKQAPSAEMNQSESNRSKID